MTIGKNHINLCIYFKSTDLHCYHMFSIVSHPVIHHSANFPFHCHISYDSNVVILAMLIQSQSPIKLEITFLCLLICNKLLSHTY